MPARGSMLLPLVLVACSAPAPQPASPLARQAASAAPATSAQGARSSEADDEAPVPATRSLRVALFKNGLAFAQRELEVPAGATRVRLEELPVPVHGSFWLAADPARLVVARGVARRASVRESQEASTVVELLRANVGKRLTLVVGEQTLSGTLLAMPQPEPGPRPLQREFVPPTPQGELLVLRTERGEVALAPSRVEQVLSADGPLAREYARERPAVSLSVELERKAAGAASLHVLSLERGLAWAPSYAIDLSDPERATLTAKAEILVEAEDLTGATLELVTGFPNLEYADVDAPIALQGDLQAFLAALAGARNPGGANVMMQKMVSARGFADEAAGAPFPTAGAPEQGTSVEDLFLYELRDVTLARGERGLFPLFSLRVPYEHLYEWSIAPPVEAWRGQQPQESEEEVWHSVRLTNDSQVPWTTAPAMTMKQGRLLGQDTLAYAAAGAKTTVRITRAVDVEAKQAEYETERDSNAVRVFGDNYYTLTRRGELEVANHKREAIRLEITRTIEGELGANPDGAEAVRLPDRQRDANPTTRLRWTVPLEPGATRKLVYEYSVLVRA